MSDGAALPLVFMFAPFQSGDEPATPSTIRARGWVRAQGVSLVGLNAERQCRAAVSLR